MIIPHQVEEEGKENAAKVQEVAVKVEVEVQEVLTKEEKNEANLQVGVKVEVEVEVVQEIGKFWIIVQYSSVKMN